MDDGYRQNTDGVNWTDTKPVFTEGTWEIHGNPLRHTRLNPALSRVVHYCESDPFPHGKKQSCHVWAHLFKNLVCPVCQERMPDSVQTLWYLQNFDIEFCESSFVSDWSLK